MRRLKDHEGRSIRLTEERLRHILLRPEMVDMEEGLMETLANPHHVVQSLSDANVQLYYRKYPVTPVTENSCA